MGVSIKEILFEEKSDISALETEQLKRELELLKNWLSDKENLLKDREEKYTVLVDRLIKTIEIFYTLRNMQTAEKVPQPLSELDLKNKAIFELIEIWQKEFDQVSHYIQEQITKNSL